MGQTYNGNTKRSKPKENQLEILGISSREFMHSVGNSAEDRRYGIERCWAYISIFENTPKVAASLPKKLTRLYLVVQGKAQLEHSSHIVNVGVEATC